MAAVWLKVFLADNNPADHPASAIGLGLSFAFLVGGAACALRHRYTAADSLACHLALLRHCQHDVPAEGRLGSDRDKAEQQKKERDRQFRASNRLLNGAIWLLVVGVAAFCVALVTLVKR